MKLYRFGILFFLLAGPVAVVSGQKVVYTINADSTKLTGCDSNELIIENHTQNVPGFLFNTGKGRTIFKRGVVKLNDSLYVIGGDTLKSNAWLQGGNRFDATGKFGTIDSNHIDFYTNNVRQGRWAAAGNLLLGSTTDVGGYKLQVNGGMFMDGGTFYKKYYTDISNASFKIGSGYELYGVPHASGGYSLYFSGGLDGSWNSGWDVAFGNSANRIMTIKDSLITTNRVLNINGGALIGAQSTYSTSPYVGFKYQTSGGWSWALLNSSNTPNFIVGSNGNVLVGTTTDNGYRLHLKGSAWLDSSYRLAWDNRQVTIGDFSQSAYEGIAIGFNSSAMYPGAVSIGKAAVAGASNVVHIGYYNVATSETVANTVRIGTNGQSFLRIHDRSTAVGVISSTTTDIEGGTAVGYKALAQGRYSIALGVFSVAENDGDFVAGAGNFASGEKPITNVYFGSGRDRNLAGTKYAGSGIAYTINGSGAYGTDNDGGNITIAGGKGTGAGAPGNVIFSTATTHSSDTILQSLTERARFSGSNGYFGLGTTSPTAQLHTTGGVRFAGLTQDSTQTRVLVSDGSGNLYYRSAASLAANDILRSSLAVNGIITAKEIRLSRQGWADYVFDSAYTLMPLREVDGYIHVHRHLPGIPSATEVTRDGIAVGETQTVLLKKIEELTLYTIDQDKKINELNKKVEMLMEKIQSIEKK